MTRLRRIASWIHLYGGLALGIVLIVISVSGSALVFKDPIDRWLRPDLRQVEVGGSWVSLDEMMAAVRAAYPGDRPYLVEMPDDAAGSVTVWLGPDAPRVFVNPYRGTLLGTRGPDEGVVNTLSALHINLFAGGIGLKMVGVLGLLLVVLTVTGLILWWPRRLQALWAALRIAWRHGSLRFNYDLHRAGGFYTTIFLLLTALTGAAFAFYPTAKHLVNTATASEPWPPAPPTVEVPPDSSRDPDQIGYEAALQSALKRLPGAEPSFMYVPATPTEPLTVRLRTPQEWHPNGRSFVHAHPNPDRGAILRVDDAREAPLGARLLQTFYPLHIGAVGGLLGKVLYVIFGLAPAVLTVTGTVIWYGRWRRATPTNSPPSTPDTRPAVLPDRPRDGRARAQGRSAND